MDKIVPLCADLDGTLIQSDLLMESFLVLIKRNFLYLFLIPIWLLRLKFDNLLSLCADIPASLG
jgi:hypothetical protein